MATKTIKLIDARALDVFIELRKEWGDWSAKKFIEYFADTINKDCEKNKTDSQIAKHIEKLYMKD